MLTRWTTESEKEQLLGLQTAEILDMAARREFQRITQLTSQMFMVPIAIITVLDEQAMVQGARRCGHGRQPAHGRLLRPHHQKRRNHGDS